jgi:hypothetical protein
MQPDLILQTMLYTLELLRNAKTEERSEYNRRLAILVTEMEKVYAYYVTFSKWNMPDA